MHTAVGPAGSPAVLLAGRAGQGLAAAVLQPAVLSAMTRVATGPGRARSWSIWSAVGAGGLAAGATVGGVLTDVDWRLAVGVVVPVCLLVAGRAGVLPPAPDVIVGERSATPLWGSDLRRRPEVRLGAVLAAVYMAGPGALYFLLTTMPGSSGRAGLLLLPLTLGVVAGSAAAGRVVARLGEERGAGLGFAVATVGTAWLALGPGSVVGPVACSLLAGLGSGTAFTAVFALAGRDVPEHRRGTAGAVVASAQYLASTVALAAFGALDPDRGGRPPARAGARGGRVGAGRCGGTGGAPWLRRSSTLITGMRRIRTRRPRILVRRAIMPDRWRAHRRLSATGAALP